MVEYLIATSIGLAILSAALVLWGYASKTSASLLGYIDLSAKSKNALDRISQQIRNAKDVQSASANNLVLFMPGHTGANINTLTYSYDSTNKTLTQTVTKNAGYRQTTTLLNRCTNFSFSVYQRTPTSNSAALIPNMWATNTLKVVEMRWACTSPVTGDKSSVETQVSAKVVIRNK